MALKTYTPTTPGQRQLVMVDRSALYKGKPLKALTEGKQSSGGRNNTGRMVVRFRGGGHKQSYRIVDFKRTNVDIAATVARLEYAPNRTAFIALVKYSDGTQAYILAPQRLAVGDTVIAGNYVDVKPGNVMPLGNMPIGTIIHNVELKIGKGGQLADPRRRRYRDRRQLCRREAGQRHAARQHADRHHHPQCGTENRQGRPARAFRRHLCPARRPRPRLRDRAFELRREAPG